MSYKALWRLCLVYIFLPIVISHAQFHIFIDGNKFNHDDIANDVARCNLDTRKWIAAARLSYAHLAIAWPWCVCMCVYVKDIGMSMVEEIMPRVHTECAEERLFSAASAARACVHVFVTGFCPTAIVVYDKIVGTSTIYCIVVSRILGQLSS